MVSAWLLIFGSPGSALGRPIAPTAFGRVFEAQRSALVRIRAIKEGFPWVDGVLVGTRGELIFGAPMSPTPILEVVVSTGEKRRALLLGYDRAQAFAVARLEGGLGRALSVIQVSENARPEPDSWVLVMSHDPHGRPRPNAGLVASVKGGGANIVQVAAPARPGSPVLSPRGKLLGLALDRHRRRTRVLLTPAFIPFVVEVVRRAGL